MTNLDKLLRHAIHAYLEGNRVSGRRFGKEALNDPGFVASLKHGRRLRLDTADKLLAHMGLEPIGPAFEREANAFLDAGCAKPYVLGKEAANDGSFVARLHDEDSTFYPTVPAVRHPVRRHPAPVHPPFLAGAALMGAGAVLRSCAALGSALMLSAVVALSGCGLTAVEDARDEAHAVAQETAAARADASAELGYPADASAARRAGSGGATMPTPSRDDGGGEATGGEAPPSGGNSLPERREAPVRTSEDGRGTEKSGKRNWI